ncbi:hypothetical protein UFOVP196_44 [uncultured Caudovirales phage]|uniref:Uncharacterized protein n=1 Tax=uncultured Caudovirales phage TaxID=2100421 RepID=A0A6J7WFT4_9CAUD|nr:hypothetical protein UFOVP196_44 [uncultured Caudovirales phage]
MNEQIEIMRTLLLAELLNGDIDRAVVSDAESVLAACGDRIAHLERLVEALGTEIFFQRSCGPT